MLLKNLVKIATTWRKSAGVIVRKETRKLTGFNLSQASQRLHAEDLIEAYLVGFIEGDGSLTVTKNGLYIKYELEIESSIKDVKLLYKIKKLLGVGVISFRKRENGTKRVFFRIRNKDHLKKIILPLFDLYPMLSNKQHDYVFFKKCLDLDLIYYKDLPDYKRIITPSLMTIDSIINASYFEAWLVGFIEAKGCFSVYNQVKNNDKSLTASFEISPLNEKIIISAIRQHLSFTTKICLDKTNNFIFKGTNVRAIENIIKFLQKAPVKLQGNKKLQYLLWLKSLRNIKRYNDKINIPSNY